MPANPILFPPDFIDDADEFTLEDAVLSLQVQSLNTARRQAHTRRIGGQMSIANQNRLVKVARPILMPLYIVGPKTQAPPFLGTAAYLGGGRGYGSTFDSVYELLFSNDAISQTGVRLTDARNYPGTVGNTSEGFFCGGNLLGTTTVDRVDYLKKTVSRIAAQISQNRFGICGGIANRVKGILAGGINSMPDAVRRGERVTYGANPIITNLGNLLSSPRFAPHNGTCNQTSGYLYGGAAKAWNDTPLFSVERINYTLEPETTTAIGTILPRAHIVHACFGNLTKGYIGAGGNPSPSWNWFTDDITAFTYSGETVALLGSRLTEAKVCVDGTGSGYAGYFIGGDRSVDNWTGTTTVDKLIYSDESVSRIGSRLSKPQSDQGAISDYGAGFSH